MNTVSILGRVAKEPELRKFESGAAQARFLIAVDRQLTKAQKEAAEKAGDPTADFFNVVSWGNQAEKYVMPYLKKGARVAVTGRLSSNSFVGREGNKVTMVDIIANDVDIIDFPNRNTNSPSDSGTPTSTGSGRGNIDGATLGY